MTLEWQDTGKGLYDAEIEIVVLDRMGLLADIGAILSETKTNIRSAKMTSESKHTPVTSSSPSTPPACNTSNPSSNASTSSATSSKSTAAARGRKGTC